MKKHHIHCLTLILCWTLGCTEPSDTQSTQESEVFSATNIRHHMTVLASDDMKGREAGSVGYQKAAEHVASSFLKAGLQQAGDAGTYFQSVPLISTQLAQGSGQFHLVNDGSRTSLVFGDDFIQYGGFGDPSESVEAPLVFVGYGITAPDIDYDDYEGLDVQGKIVVLFSRTPKSFDSSHRAYYSSWIVKRKIAAEKGSVGVVTVYRDENLQRQSWEDVVRSSRSSDMQWLGEHGNASESYTQLSGSALLNPTGARKVFAMAGFDFDQVSANYDDEKIRGFDLGLSAQVSRRSIQSQTSAPNVVGYLPGSDPNLKAEGIVFSAHLDHLGIDPDTGDIYNGAYDNAAGVATLLEVARTLSQRSSHLRRSVYFVAYTAEEKGLIGSDYFANHPPLPTRHIIANVNIDMPYLGFPFGDVEGFGVQHSTIEQTLAEVAKRNGLQLSPDPRPELVRLIRSDQYSLVKKGVPGLNLKPGSISLDPNIDGAEMWKTYLHDHYHDPSDDLSLPFNNNAAEAYARVVHDLIWELAQSETRPAWKPGDFFGNHFGSE